MAGILSLACPGIGLVTTPPKTRVAYRPDIDGLRAVAILLVLLFHAFPDVLPGGFVGVDVFFVISGYLITAILLKTLAAERFSVREFYARRVRRIFPALMLVLTACLAFGWFRLLADEYAQLGMHAAATSVFGVNFVLWREAGYFDTAAVLKPLLHLWSLSIEEQFYVVWPLLLWLAWKFRMNLLAVTLAIATSSFIYGVWITHTDAVAAFYSPLSRCWELALGCALAIHGARNPAATISDRSIARTLMATAGVLLLAVGAVWVRGSSGFPGWWALLPTGGAALLISAGPDAWINRRILACPTFVWIGLISYPLYLWHWPLLVLSRSWIGDASSAPVRSGIVALSVGLAWITYRSIEYPIRFGRSPVRSVALLCGALATLAGLGALTMTSGWTLQPGDMNSYAAYFDSFRTGVSPAREELVEINQNQCNFYDFESPLPTRIPRPPSTPTATPVSLAGQCCCGATPIRRISFTACERRCRPIRPCCSSMPRGAARTRSI